jgi:hypothetical protein
MKKVLTAGLVACFCLLGVNASAQKENILTYRKANPFLGSQWYFGPTGGLNISTPLPFNRFSVLSPNNSFDEELYFKDYSGQDNTGVQLGVQLIFQFSQRFMVVSKPTFTSYQFGYSQRIRWSDSLNPNDETITDFEHQHRFNYLQVPLLLRFEIKERHSVMWNRESRKPRLQKITPYVQAGPFVGFRLSANKEVDVIQIDEGFSATINSLNINVNRQVNLLQAGVMGGAGLKFWVNSFYLTTDINYKIGLNNAINSGNRFGEPRMVAGAYDVFDDMRLGAVELNIGVLIPLKYLTSGSTLPVMP